MPHKNSKKPLQEQYVVETLLKAILFPLNDQQPCKPTHIAFMNTSVFSSKKVFPEILHAIKEYSIEACMFEDIPEKEKRITSFTNTNNQTVPPKNIDPKTVQYNEPPPRRCYACHVEIKGKPSQCSACKAIIYCSPDCAVNI